ncbi:hypothetical protein FRC08_018871 [Ceratobasidium sp. 394]|nr:hypothetical protein FRC08_018871 [Ceratobasidium sp. 394]
MELSLGHSMESLTLADNTPSMSAKKRESESEDGWGTWEEETTKELEEVLSDTLSLPALILEDQL